MKRLLISGIIIALWLLVYSIFPTAGEVFLIIFAAVGIRYLSVLFTYNWKKLKEKDQ